MLTKTRSFRFAAAVLAIASFGVGVQAQTTFTKANNNTSLNLAASYTANTTVPTALDTIRLDTTLTGSTTAALGGDLSIFALTSNATFQFQVGATPGATLTIGGGGITKSNGAAPLLIASAVALSENQVWTLTGGGGTQNLQLNTTSFTTNGNTLSVTGNSTLDIRALGSLTLGSTVTFDTSVSINGNSTTTDVTFGGSNTNNTLNIVAGRLSGNTIGNFGVASAFGDGGTNTAIVVGGGTAGQNGVMIYTGNTASSNRTVTRDARSVASGINVTTAGETLTITGNVGSGTQVNAAGSGWVFGGAGNLTLTGVISNTSNVSSAGTAITKLGAGTLTLGGASNSTYTGNTTVTEGILIAITDKSLGNTAAVSVAGGTFEIRGATAGTVTIGAAGNFSLTSGVIKFQLGTAFDQLVSSGAGAFTISGGNFELDVTGPGFSYGDTYAVLSGFGGSNSVSGLSFSGFDTAGYTAALGTDGVLSFTVVPEPSIVVLLAIGIGVALIMRRRVRANG